MKENKLTGENKLIIALDVETVGRARELVGALRDVAGMFKIGSQLFTAAGPEFVREIVAAGSRVFLDLKFHDIPSTVAAAGREAARLGVSIFNVHAAGGSEMMKRTAEAVAEVSEREGLARPKVIAVTVLTSSDAATLKEVGLMFEPGEQVARLARLAAECGLDGVVASPLEVELVRSVVEHEDFVLVTPGVRPAGVDAHDQKRVMTPAAAVRAGADYLVVGRAILDADNPAQAAQLILEEMRGAFEAA
ncbi:MAG: orotidine-5'-phosphate decarboxylase [Blastocatellia bacterium]|jgi:orotidine-5'-phosphate decarboxylase|nr:orotidine-5'-phosphate decarboxylase [Blastocatellia bacterium]